LPLLPALFVVRSRFAGPLLPERDVLGQARAKLLGAGRVAVDLDEAEDGRDPSQEAEPGTRGHAPNLLGEMVKALAHASRACHARGAPGRA
jgi:hypothetical protein